MTKNQLVKERCQIRIANKYRHRRRHIVEFDKAIPGTDPKKFKFDVICYRERGVFLPPKCYIVYDIYDSIDLDDVDDFKEKVEYLDEIEKAHMGYRIANPLALNKIEKLSDDSFAIAAEMCAKE